MIKKIYNYVDFKSINSSVKYLSISALFTGIALGFFFTLIVIVAKNNGYSEGIIGIIAGSFSLGLMLAGFVVSSILDKIGLYTVPSAANFLLTQFSSPKAAENANRHLRRDGIIVREMGAYHLSNCLRITVGKEEENIRLLQSLSRYSTETG